VNTAAAHALAYPLGAEYHVPHGLSIAVLLPAVMEFNLPAAVERYARIARALGAAEGKTGKETAASGVARVRAISHQIGTDRPLSSFGVTAADIPRLAEAGVKVTRLLVNNPRPVTQADAERIYRSAL
jgi:alcohol dehydrogenase